MNSSDNSEPAEITIESAVEKVKKKNEAKINYEIAKEKISKKNPCEHCAEAGEEINVGDTVCVESVDPKKFCVPRLHKIIGVVEKIDDTKITLFGYDGIIKEFVIQKICSKCYRIISQKNKGFQTGPLFFYILKTAETDQFLISAVASFDFSSFYFNRN